MTKDEALKTWLPIINMGVENMPECKEALQMAIKALEQEPQSFKWCTDCKEYDQEKHCCHRYSKVIRDTVEEMKQEPRWIPVSEGLPEKNMVCLVSVGKLYLTQIAMYSDLMGTIDHKIFYQGDYGNRNFENITEYVKAWMPLPKPYEPQESEDKK